LLVTVARSSAYSEQVIVGLELSDLSFLVGVGRAANNGEVYRNHPHRVKQFHSFCFIRLCLITAAPGSGVRHISRCRLLTHEFVTGFHCSDTIT